MFGRGTGCWRKDETGKDRRFGFHLFDKTSGRCECGRWAPGRKPKLSPEAEGRCECQVCAGLWKTFSDGKIVHHGYQRPGWGSIFGDCYGVNAAPFPATDRLEAWLHSVIDMIAGTERAIEALPRIVEMNLSFREFFGYGHKEADRAGYGDVRVKVSASATWPEYFEATREDFSARVGRDRVYLDKSPEALAVRHGLKNFEAVREQEGRRLAVQLSNLQSEKTRVSNRIAKGKELQAQAHQETKPELAEACAS